MWSWNPHKRKTEEEMHIATKNYQHLYYKLYRSRLPYTIARKCVEEHMFKKHFKSISDLDEWCFYFKACGVEY